MRTLRWMIVLPLLLLTFAPARAAAYTNADYAFTIDLPDDWSQLSSADVQAATRALSPDPDLHCFTGFMRPDSTVLLLSTTAYPDSATYDHVTPLQIQQLAAQLTAVNSAEFRTATSPATPAMGTGTTRQVVWFTQPPGFAVDYHAVNNENRSHSIAYMGRDRLVMLHFFTTTINYPFVKHSLDDIAATFHYDSRETLGLQTTYATPGDYTTWGLYGFVAFGLLVAAYILRYLFKRKAY